MASRHELDCTDCGFHTIVTGTLSAALEAGDKHRDEMDAGPTDFIIIYPRN